MECAMSDKDLEAMNRTKLDLDRNNIQMESNIELNCIESVESTYLESVLDKIQDMTSDDAYSSSVSIRSRGGSNGVTDCNDSNASSESLGNLLNTSAPYYNISLILPLYKKPLQQIHLL